MTPKDNPNLNYGWIASFHLGHTSIFDYRIRCFISENSFRIPTDFKDNNCIEISDDCY